MREYLILVGLALIMFQDLAGQSTHHVIFEKQGIDKASRAADHQESSLYFEGAIYSVGERALPNYVGRFPLRNGSVEAVVLIEDPVYVDLNSKEIRELQEAGEIGMNIDPIVHVAFDRKKPVAVVSFLPFRQDPSTRSYQMLVSCDLKITSEQGQELGSYKSFTSASKLATGEWYRVGVSTSGIHRLTYSDLEGLGVDVENVDPSLINMYGNHYGQLPFQNNIERPDDLLINRILMNDGGDGSFDQNDNILFYASGPHTWKLDPSTSRFEHHKHLYSDSAYYYIGIGVDPPARIQMQNSTTDATTNTVTTFNDYDHYEKDWNNLIKSGREFYGEYFDLVTTYNQSFNMPNIVQSEPAFLEVNVIARTIGTGNSSSFDVIVGSMANSNFTVNGVSGSYVGDFARPATDVLQFYPTQNNIPVSLTFNKHNPVTSVAWLNYSVLNATRQLRMNGSQMAFRDTVSAGVGSVSEFQITNGIQIHKVWEITDPTNISEVQVELSGNDLSFRLHTDSLREFVAFKNSNYLSPTLFGAVANQNLHALVPPIDLVIVAHPNFLDAANALGQFHQDEGLEVVVISTQQIYNEFSCGMRDVTAIKWMMKMLYDRAGSDPDLMPKYLCLFGDGSYDNRSNATSNQNFVPTYESANSWSPVNSYVSDDYFGLLDDGEGEGLTDLQDIGVGRLTVTTRQQAQEVVNKVFRYGKLTLVNSTQQHCNAESSGAAKDWRNIVCFASDDQSGDGFDGPIHMSQSDQLANKVVLNHPEYDIDKIFLDAYQQESTPGGERYPEAQAALRDRVQKGLLLLNYVGHGGEVGWAHERILDVSTILNWTNRDQLPLFMTATCEFSRFDDPARTSAGEYVLLNPNGGGIALMTTTRLVFSSQNFTLANNFYDHIFDETNGVPRLGDVSRLTKNASVSGSSTNHRNFSLLGDPALQMAYPAQSVVTTAVTDTNDVAIDTLMALSNVRIKGFVADINGQLDPNFNGVVYPTVFDKEQTITTLANDPPGSPFQFELQKSVIYKGKASVTNGEFEFDFVVPKDIAYQFGFGRMSYYAESFDSNAHGYKDDIYVGGSASGVSSDGEGPLVQLYLNDDRFVSGGLTSEEPVLYAKIFDDNGVNTVGNSIGHDLVATIDNNTDQAVVLNDFYESDLDTYRSGTVRYQLPKMDEGPHTLKLKVWDVYNNSSDAEIEFVVSESADLALDHVLNYPNPFTTSTEFFFEHNKVCSFLDVQVQVFTVSGKLVKTLTERVQPEGFRSEAIKWDGKDDYGDKLARGVYVYKLKVITSDGDKAEKFEKLVILN